MSNDLKMYCVFSAEAITAMGGNRGKMAAQAGHAYLHAWWDAFADPALRPLAERYQQGPSAVKVCLLAADENILATLCDAYRGKTGVTLVRDRGLTVFAKPTVTCAGIGPIDPEDREILLRALKPLI